jgi:hypothetical protein
MMKRSLVPGMRYIILCLWCGAALVLAERLATG